MHGFMPSPAEFSFEGPQPAADRGPGLGVAGPGRGDGSREAAMNVKTILAVKKLGGDIVGIEPTATLAAAAQLLAKHRIGALVIRGAGGRLAGILSERDIVSALAEHGAAGLDLPVGQTMTREVETCGEDDLVASIMERMTDRKSTRLNSSH